MNGKPLTYRVPGRSDNSTFATYTIDPQETKLGEEIRPFPAYVHARMRVTGNTLDDLNNLPGDPNDSKDKHSVRAVIVKGGYDAQLFLDMTGEGWVSVEVPQFAKWANSKEIPASFRGQIWQANPPLPLSATRRPANLQLPDSPFEDAEDTMTAVVGMGTGAAPTATTPSVDVVRASTLPDDGAGVFAPGWDAAIDVAQRGSKRIPHLTTYGLGSPFPEDAKLCAALSTFWPAVAPDVYRSMSPHGGSARGTVAPLTDEEIGQIGSLPWDGVTGPKIIQVDGKDVVEIASFLHVDYVTNAVENRFSTRLLSRITIDEYRRRILCALRVHFVLANGMDIPGTRERTLFLSFRAVNAGDPELQRAQQQGNHVFHASVYRVETCELRGNDPTKPSPQNHRLRRMDLIGHNFFFVSARDQTALRRRATDAQWGSARSE
jgi:hypothetical protein